MISLRLRPETATGLRILCLGAHSDDIEIGCGGALLELAAQYPGSSIHWAVFTASGVRAEEALRGARLFAGNSLAGEPFLESFQDGFLPYVGAEVKAKFENLKTKVSPDLIFTHYGRDAHQDHRLISELTWNTFRNHLILEYEVPKYDGDWGAPQVFVPISQANATAKVENLMAVFGSQRNKRWFEPQTFYGAMRLRGMECNSGSGYAEAFYARKLAL